MSFGERLKQARKSKNMLQSDVAKLINVSTSQYSKYERGIYEPDIEKLIEISKVLDVSVDYLLDISKELTKEELSLISDINKSNDYIIDKYDFMFVGKNPMGREDKEMFIEVIRAMVNRKG